MAPTHNILVISDLHLGEGLGGEGAVSVSALEEQLVAFVDHHARHREDGVPWRLIINGDMVDFLSIVVLPDEAEVDPLHEEDRVYGLGEDAVASLAKIRLVLEHHHALFSAFARFLDAGNAMGMVIGNHDVGFHWPEVQAAVRDAVFSQCTTAVTEERLSFHPWVYYEKGFVWVEHGHQYDGYCSFDNVLDPTDAVDSVTVEQNLGSAAMRYISNHLPINPEAENNLSFASYLAKLLDRENQGVYLGGYAKMISTLVFQWFRRQWWVDAFRTQRTRHRARVQGLADRMGLADKAVDRLLSLHVRPVYADFSRMMQSLMLYRLALTLLGLVALPASLVLSPTPLLSFGVVLTVLVASHAWFAWQREDVDPTEAMRDVANRIRRIVDAPIVIFGHSHRAVAHQIGRGAWYFNTGTWLGGPDHPAAFAHVRVTRVGKRAKATLCRWSLGNSEEIRAEWAERVAVSEANARGV